MPELSEEFLNFLRNSPGDLASFTKLIRKFLEIRGEVPQGGAQPETPGPRRWEEGKTHDLTTVGLAQADLDALAEASAEAAVIEKFLTWVRGFAAGVMFKAG